MNTYHQWKYLPSLTPPPAAGVDECLHRLEEVRRAFTDGAVAQLGRECERALEHVATIPRLYRRTNKEVGEAVGRRQ